MSEKPKNTISNVAQIAILATVFYMLWTLGIISFDAMIAISVVWTIVISFYKSPV